MKDRCVQTLIVTALDVISHKAMSKLTKYKTYNVLSQNDDCYLIVDDKGEQRWFQKSRFTIPDTVISITPKAVQSIIEKYPEAKAAIKELLPEMVKEESEYLEVRNDYKKTNLIHDNKGYPVLGYAISIAEYYGRPDLAENCFWVDTKKYKWELLPENGAGEQLLVAIKRKHN